MKLIEKQIFTLLCILFCCHILQAQSEENPGSFYKVIEDETGNQFITTRYPTYKPLSDEVHDEIHEFYDPYSGAIRLLFTDINIPGDGDLGLKVNRMHALSGPVNPKSKVFGTGT